MEIDLIEELCRLVRVRSEVTVADDGGIRRSNYREAAEAVLSLAQRVRLSAELVELEVKDGVIPTAIVKLPTESSPRKRSTLALVSHYDVVPARGPWLIGSRGVDPYEPLVAEGRVYGRGAADNKSAIVASVAALTELAEEAEELAYEPVILVTGDEEVGGLGVRALLERGFRWDRVVILDAGADYVSVGASGAVFGWVRVRGRSGHAGYPHRALNPVEAAIRLANYVLEAYKPKRASKLSRFNSPPSSPVPKVWGRFSFTIFKLPPGEPEKHNRIPSEAMLGFDARLLPEEDIESALSELYSSFSEAASLLGVEAEVSAWGQRGWYARDEVLVSEAVKAAKRAYDAVGLRQEIRTAAELGGNDGTFFDMAGMPVVAFGAMRQECNVHSENEFVYVRDLKMLKEFVKNLVGGAQHGD